MLEKELKWEVTEGWLTTKERKMAEKLIYKDENWEEHALMI